MFNDRHSLCLLHTFFLPSSLVFYVDSQNDARHPWLIFPNECGDEHMYDARWLLVPWFAQNVTSS
jgi:hypothetical protein